VNLVARGIWIALCLSTSIAIILSLLPQDALRTVNGSLPAFLVREDSVQSLSSLVDQLGDLPLHSRLLRVRWTKGKVVARIAVRNAPPFTQDDWLDAYAIAYRLLVGDTNVDETVVELVPAQNPQSVWMVIAADRQSLQGGPPPGDAAAYAFARQHLKIQKVPNG
jgi:hypothetical protein